MRVRCHTTSAAHPPPEEADGEVVVRTREGEAEHEEARCPPWAAGRTSTLSQWADRMAMACPGDLEVPWTMTAEGMAVEASGVAPLPHCLRPGASETSTFPAMAGSAPLLPTGTQAAAEEVHHREATTTVGAAMAATAAEEDTPMVVDTTASMTAALPAMVEIPTTLMRRLRRPATSRSGFLRPPPARA